MKSTILFIFLILCSVGTYAQDILGADLLVDGQASPTVWGYVQIYRTSVEPRSITIEWGDSTIDTLSTGTLPLLSDDSIYVHQYLILHTYADTGVYDITVRDSFWVDDIVNIEQPGQQALELTNTLWIRHGLSPAFQFTHSALAVDEVSGVIVHRGNYGSPIGFSRDSLVQRLVPVTETGYTFPTASNTIECCSPLVWDRPLTAGRHAFGLQLTTWGGGRIMGTATRYMTINVDSSMIVTGAVALDNPEIWGQLYPNPSSERLNFQYKGLETSPADLTIQNLQGQALYRKRVQLSPALQTHEIQVGDWPAGLYVLRVQSGERQWVRKFVVE